MRVPLPYRRECGRLVLNDEEKEEEVNYLTSGELSRVLNIIDFLNSQDKTGTESVSFEVKVYDTNGEPLGIVMFADATYAFYPEANDG